MKQIIGILVLLISFCADAQISKVVPKKPSPPRLVNDYTGTLTPDQVQALEQKLVAYDDSTSSQIAVVMINSLGGYDVAEVAIEIGREWGVGGKEFNNGIVLLVALDDRKIRIETGYGLEGRISDVTAKSIIDNDITPNFREKNYYRGLDKATDDIIQAAAGRYTAPAGYHAKKNKSKGIGFGAIILFLILIFLFAGKGGGKTGGMASRRGFSDVGAGWIIGSILGGMGRGGGGGSGWSGGGGGGGGGGFGGFGGGSFGGGGSSGSW